MFRLLRFYSLASLVAVLATAVLLTWLYRNVAINGIVQLAERNNLMLARVAISPMKPAILEFLDTTADIRPDSTRHPPLPPDLAEAVQDLMRDVSVVRIKIYNLHGVVVFSTKPGQIGKEQSNQQYITAINGGVGSNLTYRDAFDSFHDGTDVDNLAETYIPVRPSPTEPIRGVFELYTDVSQLVNQIEKTEFQMIAGALLILSAMYAVLIIVVSRASKVIDLQQRTIRDRTETLEVLSAQMLKSEELQKKKVAFELHEGLAQTLASLKLIVESSRHRKADDEAGESVDSIIPIVQQAIQQVRTIVMDLCPPSLDDLGLLPTLNRLCREFEERHPGARIERTVSLQEQDIPPPLKVILYRIIVSVLEEMAQYVTAGRIHIGLSHEDDSLILLLNDTAAEALERTASPIVNVDPPVTSAFARMEELTTLSGGVFTASHHSGGGTTLRAVWNR
jgi:signal transduction histidine kinase